MPLWDLLQAIRRQALVFCLGALLTAMALVFVHGRPGLYQTDMGIAIRPPYISINRNPYLGRDYSLIATAGVLAKMATKNSNGAQTASSSATLAGLGVTDGYQVSLPNRGGQWAYDFDRPILDVQAVGRTPQITQTNLNEALAAVSGSLEHLEDQAGVPASGRMTLALDPPHPQIGYSAGRPHRALPATLLLGLGGTATAVVAADRRRLRRRGGPLLKRLRLPLLRGGES